MKARKQESKKAIVRSGFTIVELLVATALFLLIVAMVTGAFVNGLRTQQETLRLLAASDNASLTLEQIAREARAGTGFSTSGEGELHFKNSSGNSVVYRLRNGALEKKVGGGDFSRLTAANISVSYARFMLHGETPPPDTHQPLVTIALGFSATGKGTQGITVNMQTSITPRLLDD